MINEKLKQSVSFNKEKEDAFIRDEISKLKLTRDVIGYLDQVIEEILSLKDEGYTILHHHPMTAVAPLNSMCRVIVELPEVMQKPLISSATKTGKAKYKEHLTSLKLQLAEQIAEEEALAEMEKQAAIQAQCKADRIKDILSLIK